MLRTSGNFCDAKAPRHSFLTANKIVVHREEEKDPVRLRAQQLSQPDGGSWLNQICGREFEAQSGGLEPGSIDPLAIEAMREVGIDISQKRARKVFDVWKSGQAFAYVVTVCSEAERNTRACPIFPGVTVKVSWPFPDPSTFRGSEASRLEQTRIVRDAIKSKIEDWCKKVFDRSFHRLRPD